MSESIHLKGFLKQGEDGVRFKNGCLVAELVAKKLEGAEPSKFEDAETEFESGCDFSVYVPNVNFRLYLSDKERTLDQCIDGFFRQGEIDIYGEWYGYSEYTIMGVDIKNFKIGGHDIEKILESHIGEYAHILIEVLDTTPTNPKE